MKNKILFGLAILVALSSSAMASMSFTPNYQGGSTTYFQPQVYNIPTSYIDSTSASGDTYNINTTAPGTIYLYFSDSSGTTTSITQSLTFIPTRTWAWAKVNVGDLPTGVLYITGVYLNLSYTNNRTGAASTKQTYWIGSQGIVNSGIVFDHNRLICYLTGSF